MIAHLLKGNLLLSSERPQESVLCFKRAYNLHKDILAFAGLVRAYLGIGKVKEALTFATESYKLMPLNPQALSLLGLVLSQPPDPTYRKRVIFLYLFYCFFCFIFIIFIYFYFFHRK